MFSILENDFYSKENMVILLPEQEEREVKGKFLFLRFANLNNRMYRKKKETDYEMRIWSMMMNYYDYNY